MRLIRLAEMGSFEKDSCRALFQIWRTISASDSFAEMGDRLKGLVPGHCFENLQTNQAHNVRLIRFAEMGDLESLKGHVLEHCLETCKRIRRTVCV